MVKTYVPREKYEVHAVEWQPGMEFPKGEWFYPPIVTRFGNPHLLEEGNFYCPLKPGYFIVKSLLGYETFTPEGFHKEFVEASMNS